MTSLTPTDPVAPSLGRPVPRDIKKAIEHMRAARDPKITMAELVKVCGVCERTLHKHFRTFVGASPLAYWRRLRLARVHEHLLNATSGESIGSVALKYGFEHFGRFSTQYRRSFGETPSYTLRRSRAARCASSEGDGPTGSRRASAPAGGLLGLREPPSIAISPFYSSSANRERRSFAESVAEGIASALCRVRSLVVEMASTSPGSAGQGRLAAKSAARYRLMGRITESGDHVRIVIGLVEAATEQHIWGDSYDGANSELFALQDRVTEGVVRAVLPNIRNSEIARAQRRRPEELNAYELTMRALPFVLASNPEAATRALDLLERAMELDPDYGLATAMAAWSHAQRVLHNGAPDPTVEKARALLLAERAGILDPDDSMVLTARSGVHTMAGEFEAATALIARALALDPTCGWAWERSAWLKTFSCQPDVAIEHFGRAMQLDPCSASNGNRFVGVGSAHFDVGRYKAGAFWMRKAVLEYPGTAWVNRTLAVSYARLGERLAALDSLTALRRFNPHVTIGQIVSAIPFRRDFLDRVADGLDDLGLPP